MAATTGRTLLLKFGTGTGATTVAAARTVGFTIAGEPVDVTNKDTTGQMRELLAAAGIASLQVQVAGLLVSGGTQDSDFINRAGSRSLDLYTLAFDASNTIVGSFQVTSFGISGGYNDAQEFSATLESSGAWTLA